jgi:5'-3' exonuclease
LRLCACASFTIAPLKIHLIDGTYELFRSYFGAPDAVSPSGMAVGATLGLMRSLLALLREDDVTHVGIAFDHVVESFRNDLFAGYKTSEGVPADLMAQFPLAERAAAALGVVVWPMVEFEADDAIAAATVRFAEDPRVERILVCTPDKDMAQLVVDERIVLWDRRRNLTYDDAGVRAKWGVAPHSIPDWLAVVGDSSDGYPGIPGWGAKSAAAVLAISSALFEGRLHALRNKVIMINKLIRRVFFFMLFFSFFKSILPQVKLCHILHNS